MWYMSKRFASKSQINIHAKTHQVLTCKVCHKGFASNVNLKKAFTSAW